VGGALRPPGGRDARLLLLARVLMSAQRALVGVVVPIYLARRGFSATELGALFSVVGLAAALLSTLVGFAADRVGRKPFVVMMPLLSGIAGLVFAAIDQPVALFAAAAIGSFGRGSGAGGGQIGPYQPAEQALLAGMVDDRQRNRLFGFIASASAAGGLLGAVLAVTPLSAAATRHVVSAATYRPAFLAALVLAVLSALCALPVREERAPDAGDAVPDPGAAALDPGAAALDPGAAALDPGGEPGAGPASRRLSAVSRRLVLRLWATNSVNGLAVGLFGPFITYWLYRRYGAGPSTIGELYVAGNIITIATNQLAAPLARRVGTVRTVVVVRTAQALLLPVLALMPSFAAAGVLYTLRLIVQRIGISLRQSFVMGSAPAAERARVVAYSQLPTQGISALSPSLSGYLFDEVSLAAPFELAGALQLINALLFHHFFAAEDRVRQPA
jgi:MFS family permease